MALKFQPVLQKGAIGKDSEENLIRTEVYYPQLIELNSMDLFGLVDAIMNLGSTAFTRGEWTGVISDLGSAIAQQLINGQKVTIPGLGTFVPTLETSQKNVKDPSKINSLNFTCGAKFTPDSRFDAVLSNVEWKRVAASKTGAIGSASYVLTFSKVDGEDSLAFKCSNAKVVAALNTANVVAKVNGVTKGNITKSGDMLYINSAISSTITNGTVEITMPAVSYTEGEETYNYPAQTFEIKGVTQTYSQNREDY